MAYLKWTSDLDTGIEVIDNQHRRLVAYLNELQVAITNGDAKGVDHVIDELVDYTLSHFSFEEALLEKANYPFYQAHKRVHLIFTKRIEEFQNRAKKGENVAPEILSTLQIWLVNHIKGDDSDYVASVETLLRVESSSQRQPQSWLGTTLNKFFR